MSVCLKINILMNRFGFTLQGIPTGPVVVLSYFHGGKTTHPLKKYPHLIFSYDSTPSPSKKNPPPKFFIF